MPKLDGTGPDRKGLGSGRGLGKCSDLSDSEKLQQLGKGLGLRRKSTAAEKQKSGEGKRLKS